LKTHALWTTLALCLTLAACSPTEKVGEPSGTVPVVPSQTTAAPSQTPVASPSESETAEPIVFTDDLGREVTVPYQPKRVATLIGSFADVWSLAGGDTVATANDAWTQFDLGLDESVVNLGKTTDISLERLLSAEPDFIVASCKTDLDVELMPTFEEMGIPTAYFEVNTFDEYLHMLDLCTQITGRRDLYEQNGLAVEQQVHAAMDRAAGQETQPRVLYLRASASSVKAKGGKGTVLGSMLTDLGCVNIADSDTSLLEDLSLERIIADDPDRIFIVLQGSDEAAVKEKLAAELTDNPAWNGLTAVKEGRLHFMDQKLYNLKPNNRWGDAYEGLVDLLFG